MLARLEDQMHLAQQMQGEAASNQISLFGGGTSPRSLPKKKEQVPEWPTNQKLALEREALGMYLSGHPLEKFRNDVKRLGAMTIAELKEIDPTSAPRKNGRRSFAEVRVAGVVTALKLKNTKKGDRYASFTFEDFSGTIETLVWPDAYQKVAHLLVADEPMLLIGRPDITEDRSILIAEKMDSLISIRDKSATHGLLLLKDEDNIEERLPSLLSVLKKHAGPCPVRVRLLLPHAEVSLALRDERQQAISVLPSEGLSDEVERLFGRPVLSFY
jgi:DNA polymerase-3 subunit alpha